MKLLSRWSISLAMVALVMVLLAPPVDAAPITPTPHSFYGTVQINGQPAPPGTVVTTKFGAGVESGNITTTEIGKYGDQTMAIYLAVTHDDLHEGDLISFYINGVDTTQTYPFTPAGGPTELNLISPLTISSKTPAANALNVAFTANITVQFSASINSTTVNENTFNMDASMSGNVSGTYFGGGTNNITFIPNAGFKVGETVTVTLTTGIEGEDGTTLANPVTWQFVVEAPQGYACFKDSGQTLGTLASLGVALGDVDGDGDLDAFMANYGQANKVWLNDSSGDFSDSGQSLGSSDSESVALGDVDGDGDLDAFVANPGQSNRVWMNDGIGNFTDGGQPLGSSTSEGVALGDVDGDGDLDAFVANDGQGNKVWMNDGIGNFIDGGQSLGSSNSSAISLGDVDGDGDLDAFVVNYNNQGNTVWLNNGSGNFTDSVGPLGSYQSSGLSLGDLDSDGDLDAFVANWDQGNKVWINDSSGHFTDGGQSLGSSNSSSVALGDIDGDGDLDAFVVNYDNQPNKLWMNDGSGNFADGGQSLGSSRSYGISLGDVDGDGDLDALVTNIGQSNKVWLNVPLIVSSTAADNITVTTATLNGSLDDIGGYSSVNVSFEWGTPSGNLTKWTAPQLMDVTGNFSDNISGLLSNTTYYFRARATADGVTVNGTELNFTTKTLVSLDITPDDLVLTSNRTQQFTAMGTCSDTSTENLTTAVTWASDNGSVAGIGEHTGLALSGAAGQAKITATFSGISDNTTLTVNSSVEVNSGDTVFLTPVGTAGENRTDILLAIKGIPDLGPDTGVGGFTFDLIWDKDVINVDNITAETITGFTISASSANNTTGAANITGLEDGSYLVGNNPVATIGVRTVGSPGESTSINITITNLIDHNLDPISAVSLNATVEIVTLVVDISVALEGFARPDPEGWEIPVTIKFFTPGADVMSVSPFYSCNRTTVKSGGTATANVTDITPGTCDVALVSDHTLLNVKRDVVVTAPSTLVDMGTLLEADADGDGWVFLLDFNVLKASFGKIPAMGGYDARADFDRDNYIFLPDFNLLKQNFGRTSPVEVP
ncbi:FG-GAP-like repeat-containing protein [Chloroflexota bacterium]